MSFSATKKTVSVFTAFTLLASLMLSVQVGLAAPAASADLSEMPCEGHEQPKEIDQSPTDCASHCVTGNLEHLVSYTFDRTAPPELKTVPVTHSSHPDSGYTPSRLVVTDLARGPPGTDLYLITQRLRL